MAETAAPAKPSVRAAAPPTLRLEQQEYVFQLLQKFPNNVEVTPDMSYVPPDSAFTTRMSDYATMLVIPMADDVYWPYMDGKPVGVEAEYNPDECEYRPRAIRFVAGAKSIFVDEQEAGTEAYKPDERGRNRLLDNSANRELLNFQKGEIRVPVNDRVRRHYLWCRNDCQNQNPRCIYNGRKAKQMNIQFRMIDLLATARMAIMESEQRAKAFDLAKTNRRENMIPHAKYLKIPFNYPGTQEPKDDAVLKADYEDFAYRNPAIFLESFKNPAVKLIYQIEGLVADGTITLGGINRGQAHWTPNQSMIAQLPGDQDPMEFLAGFAMTKDGEEFANLLRGHKI